jgi:AcrR family transcriptional regulator
MSPDTDILPQSKREANKLDKVTRIKQAARELFVVHGYDETTTREIAARAGVALGTLFSYATNKRDLLFLVGNDLLEQTRLQAQQSIEDRFILENFVVFSAYHYAALSVEPTLSKLILRELLFYDSGIQAIRAIENRALLLKNLETMIEISSARGEIELPVQASVVCSILFEILQGEIRRWLGTGVLDLLEGIGRLWTSAALVINGISKQRVPLIPEKRRLRVLVRSVASR